MPATLPPTMISALPLETAIHDHLQRDDLAGLRQLLEAEHAPDIAAVLDRFSEQERAAVFANLPRRLAAVVLSEAGSETVRALLRPLTPEDVGDLLDELPMDAVANLLTDAVPDQKDFRCRFRRAKHG